MADHGEDPDDAPPVVPPGEVGTADTQLLPLIGEAPSVRAVARRPATALPALGHSGGVAPLPRSVRATVDRRPRIVEAEVVITEVRDDPPAEPVVESDETVEAVLMDEPSTEVERRGPAVFEADSWDTVAPAGRDNDDYHGRHGASARRSRRLLVLVLVLVLVGAGAVATAWALRSSGSGVAAGPSPALAGTEGSGETVGSSFPPEISSTSDLPVAAVTAPRSPGRPSPSTAPPAALAKSVVLLSNGRPTATSALENNSSLVGANAVDGNPATRWGSAWSDPQWISVDLGSVCSITRVRLTWEVAYGRAYELQTSADNATWTTVYATTSGDGGVDEATVAASGRWVRVLGTQRGTEWGYSLWELEIFGSTT